MVRAWKNLPVSLATTAQFASPSIVTETPRFASTGKIVTTGIAGGISAAYARRSARNASAFAVRRLLSRDNDHAQLGRDLRRGNERV